MRQKNIVQFFRAFTYESCTYLVIELCTNGSLMDMVKRRRGLTEPEVRFYTVQIAGAIKYMHARGIIHRDLKMGNIFLDKHMNAKIGDFGLAALLVTGKDMQTMRRTTLCGTPNYIAPEILEKGKGGHDHMVDIWSLGIIVFAMLTSKPPFQSSTTDEIYRRARERDYAWPTGDSATKIVSQAAKELVATMLVEAESRPEPDFVVQHPFFVAGYTPLEADMSPKLKDLAPEAEVFYEASQTGASRVQNMQNLRALCAECGVGPWADKRMMHTAIWREMAREEAAGLTPMIPLAEQVVYRPFADVQKEMLAEAGVGLPPGPLAPPTGLNGAISAAEPVALATRAPSNFLKAPPQSFAAQQRAQGRQASGPVSLRPLQSASTVDTLTARMSKMTVTQRIKAKKEVLKPATLQTPMATPPSSEVAQGAGDIGPQIGTVRLGQKYATGPISPPVSATNQSNTSTTASTQDSRLSLFGPNEAAATVQGTRHDEILLRLRKLQAELERALNARSMALLSTKDNTPSLPNIVVKWVDYTNKYGLGYTLNNGSVGCILRRTPAQDGAKGGDQLPPAFLLIRDAERHFARKSSPTYPDRHQIIPMAEPVSFYEYKGEEGLACLRVPAEQYRVSLESDGRPARLTLGTDVYDRRRRERVGLWKKFANYMVANGREVDGQVTTKDAAPLLQSAPLKLGNPSEAPADVISFYQRFGDVGCWMFCDGHMQVSLSSTILGHGINADCLSQFNFPDHTKIVLDAAGTWCHFWHLPQNAAVQLATKGVLEESALDDRTVLSYPVQTLLNFSVTPKQPATRTASGAGSRSTSNSTRRRPEISPDLQGIPAANDFRRKIEYIRNVVREWVANGGLGNSDLSPAGRMRWDGVREKRFAQPNAKKLWTTVGARWGDDRFDDEVAPPAGRMGEAAGKRLVS
jgi:hypothetical protein